jgi:hypothetical protein
MATERLPSADVAVPPDAPIVAGVGLVLMLPLPELLDEEEHAARIRRPTAHAASDVTR